MGPEPIGFWSLSPQLMAPIRAPRAPPTIVGTSWEWGLCALNVPECGKGAMVLDPAAKAWAEDRRLVP